MGFLSNLFSAEAKKMVTDFVDKAVGELEEAVSVTTENISKTAENITRNQSVTNTTQGKATPEAVLRDRIEKIMAATFSQYELKKNVPASVMGASSGARDYSYGVYENGMPKLFIAVLANRNDYTKSCYKAGKDAAENNGVAHFNFFTHLPNEEGYIVERLSSVL